MNKCIREFQKYAGKAETKKLLELAGSTYKSAGDEAIDLAANDILDGLLLRKSNLLAELRKTIKMDVTNPDRQGKEKPESLPKDAAKEKITDDIKYSWKGTTSFL